MKKLKTMDKKKRAKILMEVLTNVQNVSRNARVH